MYSCLHFLVKMFLFLRKEKIDSFLIGMFAISFAMASALWLGQDASWDLRNYHYYNPYAWLQNRANIDIAPAQLQSFFHPFADLPHYLMVKAGYPSWVITCILALPVALTLYFLGHLFQIASSNSKTIYIVFPVLLMAGTGASGFSVIGSTMSEWHVTALFVAALWLSLKENGSPSDNVSLQSGLLGGVAVGLKLTGAGYAVALGAMYLSMPGSPLQRIRQTAWLGLGGLIGFTLAFAPWGIEMWERFQNPLFPFFNQWFKSPWAEFSSYAATPYATQSVWETLSLPWRLMWTSGPLVSELRLQDWRLGLGFPALALLAFGPFHSDEKQQKFWLPLLVFCCVSYVIWARLYGIYRYAGLLEVLMPVAIVMATVSIFKQRKMLAVSLATVTVLTPTVWPNWGRLPHGQAAVIAKMPKLPANAMVVFATLEPVGYLAPNLPPEIPVVSLINNFMHTDPGRIQLQKLATQKVLQHQGPLWLLMQQGFEAEKYYNGKPIAMMLDEIGLASQTQSCLPIQTNFTGTLMLCPLTIQRNKLSNPA
jgi:hypothetical protein